MSHRRPRLDAHGLWNPQPAVRRRGVVRWTRQRCARCGVEWLREGLGAEAVERCDCTRGRRAFAGPKRAVEGGAVTSKRYTRGDATRRAVAKEKARAAGQALTAYAREVRVAADGSRRCPVCHRQQLTGHRCAPPPEDGAA